ncbi:MAG TPA: hypothetical protein ENH85_14500 [Candidatus Scalindua sp.]|nr:hypothetical protein [Candidatus Scalindua sp.]
MLKPQDLLRTKHIITTLQLTGDIKDMVITDLWRINGEKNEHIQRLESELVVLRGITTGGKIWN